MSGTVQWAGFATGMAFYGVATGPYQGFSGPGQQQVDWMVEVQGLIKAAGLTATKVFQHAYERQDPSGNPWEVRFPVIEVHLTPGTTPEQAQAAVEAVAAKMPLGQRVTWHYDIVPLGEFAEEAALARAAFDAAEEEAKAPETKEGLLPGVSWPAPGSDEDDDGSQTSW